MEPVFSSKKQKLQHKSDTHPDLYEPTLVTPNAQVKYPHMRHTICPGIATSFNSFPLIFEKFKQVGWDCLIIFQEKHIYPALLAEFYAHMSFIRDSTGLLTGIHTFLNSQEYVITESLIIHALNINPCMLDYPRVNDYPCPIGMSTNQCLTFKQNLATVTEQLIPAQLFDFPTKIALEFLTPSCQFLGKIFKNNVMPVRSDKLLHPFDLELMTGLLNESMPYNLPYFLLSSFEFCFHNNCLGYGRILTSIFKTLGIDFLSYESQLCQNSNIVSHLTIPPSPLIIFTPNDSEPIQSQLNLFTHINSLNRMNQLLLEKNSSMMTHIETLQLSVHHLQDMLSVLMEHLKVSLPPYNFSASTSSAPYIPLSSDELLPSLGLDFSPVFLDDF